MLVSIYNVIHIIILIIVSLLARRPQPPPSAAPAHPKSIKSYRRWRGDPSRRLRQRLPTQNRLSLTAASGGAIKSYRRFSNRLSLTEGGIKSEKKRSERKHSHFVLGRARSPIDHITWLARCV